MQFLLPAPPHKINGMNRRRLLASLLVGGAVAWGMLLAPLQWPRATLPAPRDRTPSSPTLFLSPDAKHLVTVHFYVPPDRLEGGNRGSATLWDAASGQRVAVLTDREILINSVTFSPDGAVIAGRQENGTIRLWDRSTGKLLRTIADHPEKDVHPNAQIVYAPDGRILVQVGQNWTLMRYVDTGKVAFDFRPRLGDCSSGTINHQGYYLAAGKRTAVVVRG
jgi:WD40 repeat protein